MNTDTNRKNHSNYNEKYDNNCKLENKLTSNFSYKNSLNINNFKEAKYEPKSISNNLISIDSNRTLKHMNKRPTINYIQNISSSGINSSNNYISKDIIYEDENSNSRSSFSNLYNQKLYLNGGMASPLSLKKKLKNINNNTFKYANKENEDIGFNESDFKYKFETLKNRMNKLIGNLFDIIEMQEIVHNKINNE